MVVEWKSDGGERQSREKRAMEERERKKKRRPFFWFRDRYGR